MSTSPIPSSVPSLPTLPVEIMRMIASRALQQDQEFREKKDNIHEIEDEEFYPPREDVKEGNSLNALFLLDRAWSAVAAPLLFRRLTSPNCTSPLFRGVILLKFASFVEEVAFSMGEGLSEEEGAAEDAIDKELMISLPLFPRLRRLELYAYHAFTFLSLSVLHGAAARPSQEVKSHRESFCYAVRNVKELVLHDSTAPVFSWVLLAMPALERLSIRGLLSGDGEEEPNPMTKEGERWLFETSVADCQNLVELDIVDEHAWASPDDRIGFGDSWREHEWTFRSTLRSLSIIRAGDDLAESLWSFAQHFADSLEVLKLGRLTGNTAADEVLHPRQIGSQTVEFPHLHTLNAGITDSTFPILLRRFSSSPLRRLEHCLTDDDNVSEDFFSTQLISTLKTHHSTLREVSPEQLRPRPCLRALQTPSPSPRRRLAVRHYTEQWLGYLVGVDAQ
ncbi:hypothetical protein BCR35DRAFT_311023 [Leucosporidium creatinivorum]|uniref:F-box domain-containing protein n=1 Tax=Leucosporidium creatinivorum TaxID=106004 RepID=A0A1Y2CH14_9BASI|nr:hypothetical protein BCR35DRAFT_311023 [Leucosporidium creatinivorum]